MKVPIELRYPDARLKVGRVLMTNSQPELSLFSTSCCSWSAVDQLRPHLSPSFAAQKCLRHRQELHLIDLLTTVGKDTMEKAHKEGIISPVVNKPQTDKLQIS